MLLCFAVLVWFAVGYDAAAHMVSLCIGSWRLAAGSMAGSCKHDDAVLEVAWGWLAWFLSYMTMRQH